MASQTYLKFVVMGIVLILGSFSFTSKTLGYCTAYGNCDEYIYGVQVGTINSWGTPCSIYRDYTSSYSTEMEIGVSYPISVITAVAGVPYSGYDGDQIGIWVDWNQDDDFYDTNETVYIAGGFGLFTTVITPPPGAVPGETRMRIRLTYTGLVHSCGSTAYGEVEDYTIVIPDTGKCEINGYKFNDENKNSQWDGEETGMAGWEIYLDLNENGARDAGEPNTITSAAPLGYYEFPDLTPDSYIVSEVQRPDWTQTFPLGNGNYSLTLDPNDIITLNFGNYFGIFDYGGGTGEPDDPYLIYSPQHMNQIGENPDDWGKHFKLMADIDLGAYDGQSGRPYFNIIGTEYVWANSTFNGDGFTGVFDGNNHTISNFRYDSLSTNCVGLFRGIEGGTVKKLGLVNVYVNVGKMAASLAAMVTHGGIIDNCWVDGGTINGYDSTGGLIGYVWYGATITDSFSNVTVSGQSDVGGFIGFNNMDGYIARCYATGNVNGYQNVGGFLGSSRESLIEQCYATSDIVATYRDVGGFAGSISDYNAINDCYARGNVTGYDYVGNFLGRNTSYTSDIIRCYATGYITGTGGSWVHGMIGRYYPDCYTIDYNFFDTQTSGTTDGCAATGKSTALMYQASTYTTEGWDFDSPIWTIEEGLDYPQLWWHTYHENDAYGGGTGRPADPYLIYTAEQMNAIGANPDDWDKHFKLMEDINLSDYSGDQFNMIGEWSVSQTNFTGTFDGNNHTISHFSYIYNGIYQKGIGIFSGIDHPNAVVKDLTLIDPNVYGGENGASIGSLVGDLDDGTLINCSVEGGYVSSNSYFENGGLIGEVSANGVVTNCSAISTEVTNTTGSAGGLAGVNYGTISNCRAVCSVTGDHEVGGLVGYSQGAAAYIESCSSSGDVSGVQHVGGLVGENSATITKSCSTGTISASQTNIGGLVGRNINGQIDNCYSIVEVNGGSECGGLVGLNWSTSAPTTITNCYSAGTVSGTSTLGGLVGYNVNGTITGSFWDSSVDSHNNGLGIPKTTEQMQTQITFTNAAWDFNTESDNGDEDIWYIDEGNNYPSLCWDLGLKYGGGYGTMEFPYLIYTASQMNKIGINSDDWWNKHFKLMANISLSDYTGTEFNLIGQYYHQISRPDGKPFRGIFDGNGHTISDFSYTADYNTNYIGIFRNIRYPGEIRNLGLINPQMDDSSYTMNHVGPIAGRLDAGAIIGCWVEGGTIKADDYIGGLIGNNYGGSIISCSSTASVTGNSEIGGLVGVASHFVYGGNILYSYARTGHIQGNEYVGGLVGNVHNTLVKHCFSAGLVTGNTSNYIGGFVGNSDFDSIGPNIRDCFWDTTTSNQTTSAAGTGLDTDDMMDVNNYLDAGWDFAGEYENGPSDNWAMPIASGYPVLWWQRDPLPDLPAFSGGTGEAESPYLISSVQELNYIGHNPRMMDKHYRLTCDLNMTGHDFYSIGHEAYPFCGSFDGDNHTITGISILPEPNALLLGVGFTNHLDHSNASINNLTLVDPYIHYNFCMRVGSLAGIVRDGLITNCHIINTNVTGLYYVGGLVGENVGGTIRESSSTGSVTGNSEIGGLVGYNNIQILNYQVYYGTIMDCYAHMTVSGDDYVGGLVGRNIFSPIYYSYAVCNVSGEGNYVGGFIGSNSNSSSIDRDHTACFWDSTICTLPGIGNSTDPNVMGESTTNMKMADTFINAGWDFVGETANGTEDIWAICDGANYPRLSWQVSAGDFICPEGVDIFDFAFFANRWLDENCSVVNNCAGTDLNQSGVVDAADLYLWLQYWLANP